MVRLPVGISQSSVGSIVVFEFCGFLTSNIGVVCVLIFAVFYCVLILKLCNMLQCLVCYNNLITRHMVSFVFGQVNNFYLCF